MSVVAVTAAEILQLITEARRLSALCGDCSPAERLAYFEHKVEVLERLAATGSLLVDPRLVDEVLVHARGCRDELRALAAGSRSA